MHWRIEYLLYHSSWDCLGPGNRKPHSHRMQSQGGGRQPCPSMRKRLESAVSIPCAGPVLRIWLQFLGLTERASLPVTTCIPMDGFSFAVLHHLQCFCLSCREAVWAMNKQKMNRWAEPKPFLKAPCLCSFCKQGNLLPILSPTKSALQNAVHLVTFPEEACETSITFWWSPLPCWKCRGFFIFLRHNSPLKTVLL